MTYHQVGGPTTIFHPNFPSHTFSSSPAKTTPLKVILDRFEVYFCCALEVSQTSVPVLSTLPPTFPPPNTSTTSTVDPQIHPQPWINHPKCPQISLFRVHFLGAFSKFQPHRGGDNLIKMATVSPANRGQRLYSSIKQIRPQSFSSWFSGWFFRLFFADSLIFLLASSLCRLPFFDSLIFLLVSSV